MRRPGQLARGTVAAVLLIASIGAAAAQSGIDTLVQPHGVVIPGLPRGPPGPAFFPIANGAEANDYSIFKGFGFPTTKPFNDISAAGVVRTTEPVEYYVRLYALGTASGPVGSWIMRASAVRG